MKLNEHEVRNKIHVIDKYFMDPEGNSSIQ